MSHKSTWHLLFAAALVGLALATAAGPVMARCVATSSHAFAANREAVG